jgi:hypothetical protein
VGVSSNTGPVAIQGLPEAVGLLKNRILELGGVVRQPLCSAAKAPSDDRPEGHRRPNTWGPLRIAARLQMQPADGGLRNRGKVLPNWLRDATCPSPFLPLPC